MNLSPMIIYFSIFQGNVTAKKPPMPVFKSKIDFCELAESKKVTQLKEAVIALGINPPKCPVQPVSTFKAIVIEISKHRYTLKFS